MKKWSLKLLVLIFCLLLLPQTKAFAAEKESLESFTGMDELWESVPEDLDAEALQELMEKPDSESFLQGLWDGIQSIFGVGLKSGIQLLAKLLALLLFAALYRATKDSFCFPGGESAFDFLFLLCLSLTCFSSLQECLTLAKDAFDGIHRFFLASLPVTTVLLTLSGSPNAASCMAASMNLMISAVSTFVSPCLSGLLNTLFAFTSLNGILDGGLNSFLAFLKKTVKVLCILFFTLITASLALKNALATAADSLAMRSVRFAAGNFIPVVGSLVGESAKTLSASFSVVKAECGILCILVLAYLLLRPILCIAVQKFFLGLGAAFAEIVGEKQIQGFLKALSGLLDLLMALLISQGCFMIFYITLFLTNRGSF